MAEVSKVHNSPKNRRRHLGGFRTLHLGQPWRAVVLAKSLAGSKKGTRREHIAPPAVEPHLRARLRSSTLHNPQSFEELELSLGTAAHPDWAAEDLTISIPRQPQMFQYPVHHHQ
jgi:hypothetical protein